MDLSGEQDDKFPPELKVLVNGIELDTKGGPFPMDITALCKITCDALNLIQVSSIGLGNYYVISVSLVKKLTVSNLIEKLKTKKPLTMQDTQTLSIFRRCWKKHRLVQECRSRRMVRGLQF
ncbi:hypothetical protein OTU49_006893 [Cherax quadricarinatus]|uniref:PINIT domain-containing protein n=1 Tax=Cherax quadricarinatus TaxID=27406 RepID=A0AAW0WKS1_CHEQU